jgi:hypothetical protein
MRRIGIGSARKQLLPIRGTLSLQLALRPEPVFFRRATLATASFPVGMGQTRDFLRLIFNTMILEVLLDQ